MDGTNSPERIILLGRTPDYYFAGATPSFTAEEIGRIPTDISAKCDGRELPVTLAGEILYPDGQLEMVYPTYAFEGLQGFVDYMKKVAGHIGSCVVDPQVRLVMDSRFSLQEHARGPVGL